MQHLPKSEHENQRTAELYSTANLADLVDSDLDFIVDLAREIAKMPAALMSFVDRDRQWFKSFQGLVFPVVETDRSIAFFSNAILGRSPLIVEDALEDPRFQDHLLVISEPRIRFYGGFPLTTSGGYSIGTLSVIGFAPGVLSEHQSELLQRLAGLAVGVIEKGCALSSNSSSKSSRASTTLPRSASYDLLNLDALLGRDQFLSLLVSALDLKLTCGFSLLRIGLRDYHRVAAVYGAISAESVMDEAARRLVIALGPSASITRFSDSDFLAVVPDVCEEDALAALAKRCISLCDESFILGHRRFACGISIGIAIQEGSYSRVEDMISDADMSLRLARKQVLSAFRFMDQDARKLAVSSFELEEDLRDALRNGELCPVYQPILNLESSELVGFEVLARWCQQDRLLEPAQFMPVAEELHLTAEVDLQVIGKALNEAHLLARASPWRECYLSVNVSAALITDPELCGSFLQLVRESDLPPRWRLQVEILEESIGVNGREFDRFANALSSMGVDISVDDFGTGYSSLSRLVNLPINSFKIDRSFLAGIGVGHEKSEALLAGVSALASGLGLVTIVEGIETHEQLNWLRANGFSCGQGYLFSRPISLPAAIDYVEALPQRSTAMRPTPTSSSLIPAWRWLRGLKRQLFSQPTQRR